MEKTLLDIFNANDKMRLTIMRLQLYTNDRMKVAKI